MRDKKFEGEGGQEEKYSRNVQRGGASESEDDVGDSGHRVGARGG